MFRIWARIVSVYLPSRTQAQQQLLNKREGEDGAFDLKKDGVNRAPVK